MDGMRWDETKAFEFLEACNEAAAARERAREELAKILGEEEAGRILTKMCEACHKRGDVLEEAELAAAIW